MCAKGERKKIINRFLFNSIFSPFSFNLLFRWLHCALLLCAKAKLYWDAFIIIGATIVNCPFDCFFHFALRDGISIYISSSFHFHIISAFWKGKKLNIKTKKRRSNTPKKIHFFLLLIQIGACVSMFLYRLHSDHKNQEVIDAALKFKTI